jgi:SAM-dependent methyltransferase
MPAALGWEALLVRKERQQMKQDHSIALYQWILHEFTLEGRADFVNYLGPHLASLIHPGERVLDLCCGAGPFSFFMEAQGAQVTAIDFAADMIRLAREAALKRSTTVEFVQADILTHDPGTAQFDLVVFLGNSVSDFPLEQFIQLGKRASQALKRSGRFAIHFLDGLYQFISQDYLREGVQQEEPERITRRFKEYLPERLAYIEIYRNEVTGEELEYTSYVYSSPLVRLTLAPSFELERSIRLSERSFLDIFLLNQIK